MQLLYGLKFSPNQPIWSRSRNVCRYVDVYVLFPCDFLNASHWPSDHMIRCRPLIGLSELYILDENSEDLHSHDGLLDKNAEEVSNLHHNLQSPDGSTKGLPYVQRSAKLYNRIRECLQKKEKKHSCLHSRP